MDDFKKNKEPNFRNKIKRNLLLIFIIVISMLALALKFSSSKESVRYISERKFLIKFNNSDTETDNLEVEKVYSRIFSEFVNSSYVIDQVKNELNIKEDKIYSYFAVNTKTDVPIIEIKVETDDAQITHNVSDSIVRHSINYFNELYDTEIIEISNRNRKVSSLESDKARNILLFTISGVFISLALIYFKD